MMITLTGRMKNMRFIGIELKDSEERIPTTVDRWYDRRTSSWIVQLKDREGNQIGQAVYVGTRREAEKQEADWKKEYNI